MAEDLGQGDITSEALIPPDMEGRALIKAKEEGVAAGVDIALGVFLIVDPSLKAKSGVEDGARVKQGTVLAAVSGRVVSILKAERTALNFLSHLSGIATQTALYVAQTKGKRVKVTDTRKTTPGLRLLEKYAVKMGGGENHRLNLGDAVLIKDNHIAAGRAQGKDIKEIVAQARCGAPQGKVVEVEAATLEDALEAARAGADTVMLDNMTPDQMRRVAEVMPKGINIEASGGVNLENIRAVADTGVNLISIGALTHSAKALDVSLTMDAKSFKLP